jgi:threonylcarbamoyladenosine tRNA methylthiotransferase MtaB
LAATYRIETLGCKANAYDSQRLTEALESLGYVRAEGDAPVDVCIVNSCTVTSTADRKSRKIAARAARTAGRVYLTGCYATASPDDADAVPGLAGVYARSDWAALLRDVHGGALPPDCDPASEFGISSFGGRTRAFMKIQDGCDAFCSYCIIPHVRGVPRSRRLRSVQREARRLVESGFAELVLTGIHLGLYGRGLDGDVTLADAVRTVAATPGLGRLRISSLEGGEADDALLAAMAHPCVCAHLHLPLQSGDAEVLRRMNRRYTPEEFLDCVARARRALERPAITGDVIVGFPGETAEEFARTVEVCRSAAFSRLHIFRFSPRPGTPAAGMPGRVPDAVVRSRVTQLTELATEMAEHWAESFVGREVRVVPERCDEAGLLHGYTDRYVQIAAPGTPEDVGRPALWRCTQRCGASLVGEETV